MKKFNRILVGTVAAALLFMWAVFGFWPIPSVRGQLDARIDVSRGHYKKLGYGLPFRGSTEYARLLKERYGIDFGYIAYCTASNSQRGYADAYNEVSTAAAKRKFGRDVFKETFDEAQRNWRPPYR